MPTGSEYVRLSGWTGSAWTAVRSTRMTHLGSRRPPKIFHSTGPRAVLQMLHCRILISGADVRRREFISLIGSAAAWPLATRAQEAGRIYRLGLLVPASRETPSIAAFFDELRGSGFVQG